MSPAGSFDLSKYRNPVNWVLDLKTHPIADFVPDENTLIALWLGQSLHHQFSNHRYAPVHADKQFQFLYGDGTIRRFVEPVFGPGIPPLIGSWFGQFGDKVAANGLAGGKWKKTLHCFASLGGTFASEWGPSGRYHSILTTTFLRLLDARLMPTFIGVGQGENESFYGEPASAWLGPWTKVVDVARTIGITSPWYFGKHTYAYGKINERIRGAQLEHFHDLWR